MRGPRGEGLDQEGEGQGVEEETEGVKEQEEGVWSGGEEDETILQIEFP